MLLINQSGTSVQSLTAHDSLIEDWVIMLMTNVLDELGQSFYP